MEHMDAGAAMAIMPRMTDWGAIDLLLVLAMWAIMMAAMMLPSIVPMLLGFAFLSRQRCAQRLPYVHTSVFLLGYLAVWSGFSLLATLAQWCLLEATRYTDDGERNSAAWGRSPGHCWSLPTDTFKARVP